LEIDKSATEKQIKKAYRLQALKFHPDKNSDTEDTKKKAEEKFKEVVEAYSVLTDPNKKAKYDRGEDLEGTDFSGVDLSELFRNGGFPFGGGNFGGGGGGGGGFSFRFG